MDTITLLNQPLGKVYYNGLLLWVGRPAIVAASTSAIPSTTTVTASGVINSQSWISLNTWTREFDDRTKTNVVTNNKISMTPVLIDTHAIQNTVVLQQMINNSDDKPRYLESTSINNSLEIIQGPDGLEIKPIRL